MKNSYWRSVPTVLAAAKSSVASQGLWWALSSQSSQTSCLCILLHQRLWKPPLCSHRPKDKRGFNYSLKTEEIGFSVLRLPFPFLILPPLPFCLIFSFFIFPPTLHLALYRFLFFLLSYFPLLILSLTSNFYVAVSFISMFTLSFLCCLLCIGCSWILRTIIASHPFHYFNSSLCCRLCCFPSLTQYFSVSYISFPLQIVLCNSQIIWFW